jgi:hypothetical protein
LEKVPKICPAITAAAHGGRAKRESADERFTCQEARWEFYRHTAQSRHQE